MLACFALRANRSATSVFCLRSGST
jgi:hypothetical protein